MDHIPTPFFHANLTPVIEALADVIRLVPEGVHSIGDFIMDEARSQATPRRVRRMVEAYELAAPLFAQDAITPVEDWLSEFFVLTGKRYIPDLKHSLTEMLVQESNAPGYVPLRFVVDTARLDKEVLDEFKALGRWFIPSLQSIVSDDTRFYPLCSSAGLVGFIPEVYQRFSGATHQYRIPVGDDILILTHQPESFNLSCGSYAITPYGLFIYDLLDPKPSPDPDIVQVCRRLWNECLPL